jgi:7-cyano-7-deazaguanine reductase
VSTENLTVLGANVTGALTADQLERFPRPNSVERVRFTTHEVTALCPVTDQPDLYTVVIDYVPVDWCVESKTLKMYLMQWRNSGIFGEALAGRIADDLFTALEPTSITVVTEQQIRGGLQMTTIAERTR